MKLCRRYCCAAAGLCAVVCLFVVLSSLLTYKSGEPRPHRAAQRQYISDDDTATTDDKTRSVLQRSSFAEPVRSARYCRMLNCFELSRCQHGFTVHIHPRPEFTQTTSYMYGEILRALRASPYYTDDPEQACIFVLGFDTLDRDRLSSDFVDNMQLQINSLQWWRGGTNHLIFNLYSGTWPDYNENGLGFDVGKSILAKSSTSRVFYRPGFDISFPLFHREHSFRAGEEGVLTSSLVSPQTKYLLTFKGKRYLVGIGSETRSSLYHIHNGQDIILLTTCKHGKGWKNMEDRRCEADNLEYDKWDYKTMLINSTFCLVPRGRRLGSYRFLEVLQAACIPVVLSNEWVLPFSEVIDWNKAAVIGDERLLLQVPNIVRSQSAEDVLLMRQQTQFLWNTYFSSIEKIVSTTLEILKERVERLMQSRATYVWNTPPGSLVIISEYSQFTGDFPFYRQPTTTEAQESVLGNSFVGLFTAIVYTTSSGPVTATSSLYRHMKMIGRSQHLHKVILLWNIKEPFPTDVRWPVADYVSVVYKPSQGVVDRLHVYLDVETDAVLSVDDDFSLVTDEIDFAFSMWQNFPSRIVGFVSRSHTWDDARQAWSYTSMPLNDYSMVLTSAAICHRYYLYLSTHWLPQSLRNVVSELDACDDILLNFLVSHVTHQSPIGICPRKTGEFPHEFLSTAAAELKLRRRQYCVSHFADYFGYMPLVRSAVRFEPLLHRDPVSVHRKKYRQMENR